MNFQDRKTELVKSLRTEAKPSKKRTPLILHLALTVNRYFPQFAELTILTIDVTAGGFCGSCRIAPTEE